MTAGMTLPQLTERLAGIVGNPPISGPRSGVIRFRMAVDPAEYADTLMADIDPFGVIVGVTVTRDGATLIDIAPERSAARQGVLL